MSHLPRNPFVFTVFIFEKLKFEPHTRYVSQFNMRRFPFFCIARMIRSDASHSTR